MWLRLLLLPLLLSRAQNDSAGAREEKEQRNLTQGWSLPAGCGWSAAAGLRPGSLSSDISDYAEFPWMVALLKKSESSSFITALGYIGGGTLIHPSVVLTVAHKVAHRSAEELKCRAGEWDMSRDDEILPYQERAVRKIAVHDEYLQMYAHFDAALLFLESPFDLTGVFHIGMACLAREMPAPGTVCYTMGWGSLYDHSYTTLAVTQYTQLKKVQLPMIDPKVCQSQLRNTRLGYRYFLHQSLTCAGGDTRRDICIVDAGSSLVCPLQADNYRTRYAVYGMAAYGLGCGMLNLPEVFAKVPVMIEWIDREMESEQLGTTSYIN